MRRDGDDDGDDGDDVLRQKQGSQTPGPKAQQQESSSWPECSTWQLWK
jgi:hypothetical protein